MHTFFQIIFSLCLTAMLCSSGIAQVAELAGSAFDMAYDVQSAGKNELQSLIGQPFVGSFVHGAAAIESGLLPAAVPSATDVTISLQSGNSIALGESAELIFSVGEGFFPLESSLFYRITGVRSYTEVGLALDGNAFVATLPANAVSERGLEYYAFFSDGINTVSLPALEPAEHPLVLRVAVAERIVPHMLEDQVHKMMSIPADVGEATIFSLLADDLGEYGIWEWRLFRYLGGEYVEYPELTDVAQPGSAWWIVTRGGVQLDINNLLSTPSEQPWEITLRPGWNQIANPFAFPVDWDAVERPSGVGSLTGYDGIQAVPGINTLLPWEGYWLLNDAGSDAVISVPAIESSEPQPPMQAISGNLAEGEYVLQLSASTAGDTWEDRFNYLGIRQQATETTDELDIIEAPSVAAAGKFSVVNEEHDYAANFKPPSSAGQSWIIGIEGVAASPVMVKLAEFGHLPPGHSLYVLDLDLLYLVPVQNNAFEVLLADHRPRRSLKIITGDTNYAEQQSAGIPLVPIEFSLSHNFPNPFNPQTRINYQIKLLSEVRLEVYNVLGQPIRTLLNASQGAGLYSTTWDGHDDHGRPAASGVYLYRLQAGDFVQTRKMALIR